MADAESEETNVQEEESQESSGNEETFDEERARATIQAQRESEKAAKRALAEANKRLAALEQSEKERTDAERTELEKAQARATELEQRSQELEARMKATLTRTNVIVAASKLNIVDPDVAYQLIDKDSLDYNDDGEPSSKSVEDALSALVKAKPYLVAKEESARGVPPTPKGEKVTKTQLVEKTQQELAATGNYRL